MQEDYCCYRSLTFPFHYDTYLQWTERGKHFSKIWNAAFQGQYWFFFNLPPRIKFIGFLRFKFWCYQDRSLNPGARVVFVQSRVDNFTTNQIITESFPTSSSIKIPSLNCHGVIDLWAQCVWLQEGFGGSYISS